MGFGAFKWGHNMVSDKLKFNKNNGLWIFKPLPME
jgi:hypothetical protein